MKTWQDAIDSIDPQNTVTGTGYFDPVVESDITVFSELFGIGCEWSLAYSFTPSPNPVLSHTALGFFSGLDEFGVSSVAAPIHP